MRANVRPVHVAGLCFLLGLSAGAVSAQDEEAKNPAVKARIEAMKSNGQNLKAIADMVQKKAPFDAAKAQQAAATIAETSLKIPALFEAHEMDPVSEAKPEIWSQWSEFVKHAEALTIAARATDASSEAALAASLPRMGGACKSCHDEFRVDDN